MSVFLEAIDHDDEFATTRMWLTNELPDDIDDWPDGWRLRLEERQDALADSEELEADEALALAEELVRREFDGVDVSGRAR